MKYVAALWLCCLFTTTPFDPAKATHELGGELTWSCQGNGLYKFRLKLYRDCNGLTYPAQISMQTNHPVGFILMYLVLQTDISSSGFDSSGTVSCKNCSMGNSVSPITGLVEEFIFESSGVNLNGVPPPGGWWFGFDECCRTTPLTNINSTGNGPGFRVKARMFNYNGQNAMPCNDNSPYFAERPFALACTGQPYQFNPGAVEPDGDRLFYSWDELIADGGWLIPFLPGYSVSSPFPDTSQNPLNVAASLDPVTGHISGLNYTAGRFAYKIKVASYKCGQKVSEIERDFATAFIHDCPTLLGNAINTAPDITPPFINPVTGLQTSFADTVMAGDTVTATLGITDFELFTNTTSQAITIRGGGTQFGTNFTDPQSGCPVPPCATLSASLPQVAYAATVLNFNWVTTCDHAGDTTNQCGGNANTHVFVIWADDNYCPANARAIATISITVVGAAIAVPAGGTTFCTTDPPVNLTAWPPGGTWSGYPLGSGNLFDPAGGPGNFPVYYTWSDSTGCTSTDALVLTVNDCTGLSELQAFPLAIHPNPASDHIVIDAPFGPSARVAIFNVMGQQVYEAPLAADKTVSLPSLSRGIYFLELREGTAIGRAKVMVEQK